MGKTNHEADIMERLARGETNQEISAALHISRSTVRWYIRALMGRWGLYGTGDERRMIVRCVQCTQGGKQR